MKKGILLALVALVMAGASQAHAFQYTKGSAYMFADLLEWQMREGSDDNWGELITPTSNPDVATKIMQATFSWNTGYRIGGGYKNPSDWDAVAYYTSYHTQASNAVAAPGQVYSPYIGNFFQNNLDGAGNGPFYNAASLRWKFAFNTLDFELGHKFIIDSLLTVRPFLGLKGAIINQKIYTSWFGPNTLFLGIRVPITTFSAASENLTNYFTGVGPSFGIDTTWPLYKLANSSFNLCGNFSAALLWGLWRYHDAYQTNGNTSVTVYGDNVNGAAPMTRAFVGIEWVGMFSQASVNVRLGYEGQVWFDQVQYNSLSSGRLNDIMSLQGGVLDFGVNF